MSQFTSRLAASGKARQAEALSRADRLGDAAEALVRRAWRQLLASVRDADAPHKAHLTSMAAQRALHPLGHELATLFGERLTALAAWGHESAADAIVQRLPLRTLRRLAGVVESRRRDGDDTALPLLEAPAGNPTRRGLLSLGLPGADLGEPPDFDNLSADAARDLFRQLIFPPPSPQASRLVVYASGWQQRLANETSLALPHEIARVVYRNVAGGKSIKDLARELLPVVDGVRSTARRIARDESMRVSHTMQQAAWDQVDDIIDGYTVYAVDGGHSPTSRPEHKARHGTTYWKSPGPGQKGMDECPHPPFESARDGNRIAWNCRCYLAPHFKAAAV